LIAEIELIEEKKKTEKIIQAYYLSLTNGSKEKN
jgi:hypothetical protein